ncbi:LysR family transcriptional regulator [Acinetobacter larvae]|uniref:LysR family transcriptional regulator n=1 Tax=Acinetobacter larvae TaxID=1789224 RepID=A0A1B2M188_9GAMM|nr:LysR family transcriptional regulator [Acinetobacter larvae]AOA58921.1 LysR family transcriptional regulator [Acinetobacter larvae]
MQSMDLNLLVALDALLAEGSVTGAAERLQLSVPAMSRTLDRIRKMIGDPLFVRAGRGLVPTPRAEQLREPVRLLVLQAQQLLVKEQDFDVHAMRRVFTIRADDGTVVLLAPLIIEKMSQLAPMSTVRFIAQGQQDVVALREGRIDLDIGVIQDLGPEIIRQSLFQDRFIAVFRSENPLTHKAQLIAEDFANAQHVTVSRRGILSGPIDVELAKQGLSRHIHAVTHSFAEALFIARATDLVASLPARLTSTMRQDMQWRTLPFDTPSMTISHAWHPRFNGDYAHKVLRKIVYEICQTDAFQH